jgi:UPF0716 family protein affecting phage T7 exclusion
METLKLIGIIILVAWGLVTSIIGMFIIIKQLIARKNGKNN